MTIIIASAPCGSGKTHGIIDRAREIARKGGRVIIAQPTKELIDKTIQEELKTRSSITVAVWVGF